ncbi:MAG: carboxypeptidase-like regulatory domain-containing protein [Elusimicrobia bacterium]|nr:carboxypeptidase-like regulatory domain-containing protein [Elusimicrobiota bacterium]
MAEKDTLPCPGCHTPLPPEATGCQICMRARSKYEIMRGYTALHKAKARRRRRPFQIAAAVLLLGAGGWLFMVHGDTITAAAGSAIAAIGRWADDMRNPSNYASKSAASPAPAPAPPAAAPGAPVAPEAALSSQLFPPDAPPASPAQAPAPAPAAAPPAAPKALAKNMWRVSGTVYDLATLEPVPGADITFLRDSKEPETATTNDKGGYEIDLAKADGWTVSLEAHDHRRGQIFDIDPSYRVRDADERRAALEHISDGDLTPAPVDWKRASAKVRLDLIAVPQQWTEPRRR